MALPIVQLLAIVGTSVIQNIGLKRKQSEENQEIALNLINCG